MYPGPDTPSGIPLIKVGDIKDGSIPLKPTYCVSEKTNEEHKRTQLVGDELLITLVGNPGECVVVKPSMAGWNPARAIAVIRLHDPSIRIYLKTVLESAASRHLIDAVLNTTVQKTLNLKDIRKLPIPMPPSNTIKNISAIADVLTNRIALLRETNATLEAIAQALFKSWFVDFDPVHAKQQGREPEGMDTDNAMLFPDDFEESAVGLVPRGWQVGTLGQITVSIKNQLPPSKLHADICYVGLEHIPRQSLSLTNWDNAQGLESAKAAFTKDDILFGKLRPYFHKVTIAPFDGVCSTDILVCQSKNPAYYGIVAMYLFSTALVDYAARLSNGAKMPRINWKDLAAYPICIPPGSLAAEYTKAIKPLFDKMTENVHQAKTLTTLRDTLLPRLISGQLRLPDAEAAAA
ncbi:type I restriction endonuclease subunit S [Methylovulum psychrotolerans]|uniref:Type I restriction endonuclease subunit S n=2 Tax=Methylovulum psychrotolerans TaxID=1704499 RepID=A0A1Z4C580_9GAMM|nr:type I restriction endonuclease subunit S [Methylovulum psychrotolerans]